MSLASVIRAKGMETVGYTMAQLKTFSKGQNCGQIMDCGCH